MHKQNYIRILLLVCIAGLLQFRGTAQAISGPTCIQTGVPYSYQLSAYYSGTGNFTYTISGGTLSDGTTSGTHSGPGLASIQVTWSGAGSITLNSPAGYTFLTDTVAPTFSAGNIAPGGSQNINYNTVPAVINCSAATGGPCTTGNYVYQWQQSPDNLNYINIPGASGQNLSISAGATMTTYYRRFVTETLTNTTGYSTVASVILNPPNPILPVNGGSVTPAPQYINYNTVPSALYSTGVSGGTYTYTFQWQSSADNINWSPANCGATVYAPGNLTTTTYYRVGVTSNGVTAYSSSGAVNVYPQLFAGQLSPSLLTVLPSGNPGTLSSTLPTGGTGTYSYQWQSSTDGMNFVNIAGAPSSPTYTPGALSANTWYQLVVNSNGVTVTTNVCQVVVSSAVPDVNSIQERDILKPGVIDTANARALSSPYDVQQTTRFFDGLGRPVQTVAMQQSPALHDMVSLVQYDGFGREAFKYLPYTASTGDGNFKATALGDQSDFNMVQFPGEQYYYGQVSFEPSPLNRVTTTLSPGLSWIGSARGAGLKYLVNTAADSVMLWTIAMAPGSIPVSGNGYSAGTLYKNITMDEAGHQAIEYKDLDGRVVLKKVQLGSSPDAAHVGWLCTYYVYDIMKNLRFVIQPRAVELINNAGTWTIPQSVADELCFRYEYDLRKRMIIKKVPGAGELWMVYDYRDRLVFTQDSVLRSTGQWLGTLYDGLNRPVETGLLTYSGTQSQLQTLVTNQTSGGGASTLTTTSAPSLPANLALNINPTTGNWTATKSIKLTTGFGAPSGTIFSGTIAAGSSGSSTVQVNSSPLPSGNTFSPLTLTFYDDYSWVAATNTSLGSTLDATNTTNGTYFITGYNTSPTYAVPITRFVITRGMVTGTMSLVLGTTNQFLFSANFYDDRGRVIQTQGINYTQGRDVATTQYDFSGKALRTLLVHQKSGMNLEQHTLLTKLNYDAGFRVKSIYKNIDGATSDQLIDSMQYNELGQLRAKYIGSNVVTGASLDSLVYDYNIRGWVTGINKKYVSGVVNNYFGMELGYDKTTSVAGTTTYANPAFNGNIAGEVWKSAGDGVGRKFDFTYDNVNRLTGAAFVQNTSGLSWDNGYIDFSVSGLSYDANGNILSMNQRGFKVGGSATIDSLTYSYQNNSNKLSQVADAANDSLSKLGDFHYKGIKKAYDYTYDGNGNLSLDNNKAIDLISYNYLNLPQLVHMNGKGNIQYVYDATGTKLAKLTSDSLINHSTRTLYLGGFVYQQTDTITKPGSGVDTLQFMAHEEGRARWAYHKYLNGTAAYGWEYDFMEKDHLGNTRVLLTQQKDTAQYVATMEGAYRSTESALFYNLTNTCVARKSAPGYPVDYSVTNPNDSVARVNGSGQKVGPGIILKVMSGDKVDVSTQYYYNGGGTSGGSLSSSDLLNTLASGLVSMSGGGHGSFSDLTGTSSPLSGAISSFVTTNNPQQGASKPQAFLNWMLLDDQFKIVGTYPQSGALPVVSAGTTTGGTLQPPLAYTGIPITKSGYLYIYVSNATPNWDVYFDNLSVKAYSGPMLEENHYYPFGLTMAGISDKALKSQYAENKYRFNFGSELQNKEFSDASGLELYDAHHRMYDLQIGRFGQIDPLGDATPYYSPYSFASNNPITHIDPFGLTDSVVTTKTTNLPPVYVYAHKSTPNNWLGWPSSTVSDRRIWARNQGLYYDRLNRNQPLSQKGDPASYTGSLDMYKRGTKADKEGRAMQAWAVGIISAPALLAVSPAEVGLALRMKVGFNVGAFAVDAGLQTVANSIEHKNIFSNYNFLSGGAALFIGAPEGASLSNIVGVNAVTATVGTSVNLSANGIRTGDIFSFNPLSILIGTVFGSAAGRASQAFGGGATMDAMMAPVNFTGTAVDEGTKPKDQ